MDLSPNIVAALITASVAILLWIVTQIVSGIRADRERREEKLEELVVAVRQVLQTLRPDSLQKPGLHLDLLDSASLPEFLVRLHFPSLTGRFEELQRSMTPIADALRAGKSEEEVARVVVAGNFVHAGSELINYAIEDRAYLTKGRIGILCVEIVERVDRTE